MYKILYRNSDDQWDTVTEDIYEDFENARDQVEEFVSNDLADNAECCAYRIVSVE